MTPTRPTLVVLAAGMGSRYGGLKQIDPVGPAGEVILDYSIHDAIDAGFGKVVFVIRREIEADFRAGIGTHFESRIPVHYVHQELTDLPEGCILPAGRTKPWGTTHAILACRDVVHEPFGVINADDFYGRRAFRTLADALRQSTTAAGRHVLVGYPLCNTLSQHGTVSRGICDVTPDGTLRRIRECHEIRNTPEGISGLDQGQPRTFAPGQIVSMNLWGFSPDFFAHAQKGFRTFLKDPPDPLKSEYYIPSLVQELIDHNLAHVQVLTADETWLGVTYPEDKPAVQAGLKRLIFEGVYPPTLRT